MFGIKLQQPQWVQSVCMYHVCPSVCVCVLGQVTMIVLRQAVPC